MNLYKLISKDNLTIIQIKNYLITICLFSFFFLWDIKISLIENLVISLREIFYLLILLILLNYKKFFNKSLFRVTLFFFVFLIYNFFAFEFNFDYLDFKYNIVSIFFVFLIILISIFNTQEIIKNLNSVTIIFIYILIISFLLSDIYHLTDGEKNRLCGFVDFRLVNNIIFLEPSHLGMVFVPFCYYFFYSEKFNNFHKIILLSLLLFIFIFYYSLTLMVSIFSIFVLTLTIDYRFFIRNKLFLVCQMIILLAPIYTDNCFYKFNHTIANFTLNINQDSTNKKIENLLKSKEFVESKLNSESEFESLLENEPESISDYDPEIEINDLTYQINLFDSKKMTKKLSIEKNLSARELNYLIKKNVSKFPINNQLGVNDHSSAVLLNAFNVLYYSVQDKPFGWGLNNYQTAFNEFMLEKIVPKYHEIYYLNYNDGSNNFIKLIVEFGILSIFIFINLIYFVFNSKIRASQRILFGGIILIQMIRAAGYFNGGFILCLVLTFVLNFQSFYKNEDR